MKRCKICGDIVDDDESYDLCFPCHAKSINCEMKIVKGDDER